MGGQQTNPYPLAQQTNPWAGMLGLTGPQPPANTLTIPPANPPPLPPSQQTLELPQVYPQNLQPVSQFQGYDPQTMQQVEGPYQGGYYPLVGGTQQPPPSQQTYEVPLSQYTDEQYKAWLAQDEAQLQANPQAYIQKNVYDPVVGPQSPLYPVLSTAMKAMAWPGQQMDPVVRPVTDYVLGKQLGDWTAGQIEGFAPALAIGAALGAGGGEPPPVEQPRAPAAFTRGYDAWTTDLADRPAIKYPDGTVSKGQYGETHSELIERQRASIAKQFEKTPDIARRFDQEHFDPRTQYGYINEKGDFYTGAPTTPFPPMGGGVTVQPGARFDTGDGVLYQHSDGQWRDAPDGNPNYDLEFDNKDGHPVDDHGAPLEGQFLQAPQTEPSFGGKTGRLLPWPTRALPEIRATEPGTLLAMHEEQFPAESKQDIQRYLRQTGELNEPPQKTTGRLDPASYTGPLKSIEQRTGAPRFHASTSGEPMQYMMNPEQASFGGHLYGAGLYTTDSFDVMSGHYAAGGEFPMYNVYEIRPVKMFNVEQPLPRGVAADMFEETGDERWLDFMHPEDRQPYIKHLEWTGRTYEHPYALQYRTARGSLFPEYKQGLPEPGYEPALPIDHWYDRTRESMPAEDAEQQEEMLRNKLYWEGYGGYEHVGGRRSGTPPHNVRIYWDPKNDIRVSPVETGDPEARRYPSPEIPPPYLGRPGEQRARQSEPGSYYANRFSWDDRIDPSSGDLDTHHEDMIRSEPGYHYAGGLAADIRDIQHNGTTEGYRWAKNWTRRGFRQGAYEGLGDWADSIIRVPESASKWGGMYGMDDPNQPYQLGDISPDKIEILTRHGWKPISSINVPARGY